MKKKFAIILSAVVIFLFGIVVWYHVPIDLMDVDTNEVMEIVVFNGNSGNTTHITDKDIIRHIICPMAMKQTIGIILLSTPMIQLEKIPFSILSQKETWITTILKAL